MTPHTVKSTNNTSFIKIGAIYTISNMIVRGMAFLTTPLFTRLMSQSDYGQFSGVSSWANIISIIVTLNLYSTINRAKYDYNDSIYEYIANMLFLGNVVTAILWFVVELNINFWTDILGLNALYLRCIMLYCVVSPATQLLLCKFRMYGEYKKVISVTWFTLLVGTVSSLFLVYFLPDKLLGRVLGTYIVVAIASLPLYVFVYKKGFGIRIRSALNKDYYVYALKLALPLIPHELSGILLSSSDRIIINNLCGGTDVALYSLAYTISMILSVLLSSLNQAWVPWFYDRLSEKTEGKIKTISSVYIIFFGLMCFGLMLIGPDLVYVFGGSVYMPAEFVIPPVCVALMLQFCYTLLVNIEFYHKKTGTISIATFFATAINIGLNYLFIPQYGYIAAAYTTIAGYLFMFLFHWFVSSRLASIRNIFNVRIILATVLSTVVAYGVSLILYQNNSARYSVLILYILLIVFIGLKNLNKIKSNV